MDLNQVVLTGKRAAACKYKIALLAVDNLNTLCILGCCLAHGGLGGGKRGTFGLPGRVFDACGKVTSHIPVWKFRSPVTIILF